MKTRVLIIIGIIVVIAVFLASFSIYESSTVVFISCDPRYEQIDDKCVKKDGEIGEPVKTPPSEPSFENKEPFTKIEIMFGERLDDKLVPVIFTEVTTNAETLDEIMVWNFELIGHSAGDLRVVWDALPQDKRIMYEITDDDGLDIRIPENIISIPFDLHGYKMNCGLFQTVYGESAHPTLLQIKSNTSAIYAQNSRIGIYPDSNGEYSFEFASIFKNYVSFPEDAVEIISQEIRECKLTNNIEDNLTGKYTDGYYTKITFRFN